MNKQNKLVLKAVKAALRMVEAAEKVENKYGTSRRPREIIVTSEPYGDRKRTHEFAEPPTGKTWSQLSEKERSVRIIEALKQRLLRKDEEIKLLKVATPSTEKIIEDFAGDDRSHVYSLIEKHLSVSRTDSVSEMLEKRGEKVVHLKSPELGTETLVVLSPEGETLLKIVKDNSRKFEVK